MAKEKSHDHIRRLYARGNMVVVGTAVLLEITRESALDSACASIEAIGGHVLSITERKPTTNGKARNFTIYSVIAVLPEGTVDHD